MPIFRSKDATGPFYQYSTTGAKYRYVTGNKKSRLEAYEKAKKQRVAVKISQRKVYDFID